MRLKQIGSRLTYANVMATAAVFLALGGGAYALSGVPDRGGLFHGCVSNSTGVLRVVKSATSCHKAVRRGKHRNPGEFAVSWNQQGRPGANGINGTTGSPGTPGATNVTIRLASFVADSLRMSGHVHVDCHPGERAVGGGIGWTQSPGSGDAITYSGPIDANFTTFTFPGQGATPTGWAGEIRTSDSPGKPGQIYVICASP